MRKNAGGLPTLREVQKEAEKASVEERSRRYKKAGILAAIAAVVIILGVVIFNAIASSSSNDSKIASLVPANADTVVLTPSSSDWWDDITNMAPLHFRVNELDPYAAGLNITALGYARADDIAERAVDTKDPLRSIYIESPTEEDAVKVESWLIESDGGESRSVFRDGTVVQVTHNWVLELEVPESNIESRSDYSLGKVESQGEMWINFDNQVDALAGADNPEKSLVASYFQKSFALKDGTVWSGSSDDGITWKGEYTSGGVDMELFDPLAVTTELRATQEDIVPSTETGGLVAVKDNRLFNLVLTSGFKKTGENNNHGSLQVKGIDTPVKDEKLSAVIEPSQWNRAVLGTGAQTEGVRSMAFSMSESEMNLVLAYGGYEMTPDMPEFHGPDSGNITVLPLPVPES